MDLWRYKAVRLRAAAPDGVSEGQLMAESSAQARAALRSIGLQVVDLRRSRRRPVVPSLLAAAWSAHLRRRRREQRLDLFEGLTSLLDTGFPLVECLDLLAEERTGWLARSQRSMLIEWREAVRGGAPPAQAMARHPAWFDAIDCAIIQAGEQGGLLPNALRQLAARESRSARIGHQLVAALTYPAIVTVAAIAVAVFLSIRTLPELCGVLSAAEIPVPTLTRVVMGAGAFAAHWGGVILIAGAAAVGVGVTALRVAAQRSSQTAMLLGACTPGVIRSWTLARFSQNLADLLRAGVPAVEGLRLLSATTPRSLSLAVNRAAAAIEDGADLSEALSDPTWFHPRFRRLLQTGQATGELESTLERTAQRDEVRTERQLARLASLLEPAAILCLAAFVGTVVLAAVIPLTRLREVIG